MSTVSTDPIADMLSRIRNAIAVRKSEIVMPHSKVKESVVKLLKENDFINDYQIVDGTVGKLLRVTINDSSLNARITEIQRLSKPGRRWYASADDIPTVKRGRGLVIVSTSKGMMTGQQASTKRLGGELICKVY